MNAKIAVGGSAEVEQSASRLVPAGDLEVALELELGVRHDAGAGKRRAVAAPAVFGRHPPGGPGDRPDPPVAELEEVLHRLVGSKCVRGRDRRDPSCQASPGIDDDELESLLEERLELVVRLLRQDEQRAVRGTVERAARAT